MKWKVFGYVESTIRINFKEGERMTFISAEKYSPKIIEPIIRRAKRKILNGDTLCTIYLNDAITKRIIDNQSAAQAEKKKGGR